MARPSDQKEGSHQRTAGFAICGMGAIAAALLVATMVLDLEFGFIEPTGIAGLTAIFSTIGLGMVWSSDS